MCLFKSFEDFFFRNNVFLLVKLYNFKSFKTANEDLELGRLKKEF